MPHSNRKPFRRRPLVPLAITLLLAALPAFASEPGTSEAATRALAEASRSVLSLEMPAALDALAAVPAGQFTGKDARVRACMLDTFGRAASPSPVAGIEDPFVRRVVAAYRSYWWHTLREPGRRVEFEARLGEALAATLQIPAPTSEAAFDGLVERVGIALRERGLHVQQGRTPPLHELLLWASEQPRTYEVALPEGFTQPVRVFILEDFLSNGWMHYGRCGMRGPGGWATQEGLYAVKHRYDSLASEQFRVSFLGHEAQHYADLRRWPDMPSWQLEYRAKLTELVLADDRLDRIIEQFIRTRTDDESLPHPYANARVIKDLRARLDVAGGRTLVSVPPADIHRAARMLLIRNTRASQKGHGEHSGDRPAVSRSRGAGSRASTR